MSSDIPAKLKYVASHEWLRLEDDDMITVGIIHHAQELLGDVVFVELSEVGANLAVREQADMVKFVEVASDVYASITGEVVAINEDLPNAPETANSTPYDIGQFFKIKPTSPADYDGLLAAE